MQTGHKLLINVHETNGWRMVHVLSLKPYGDTMYNWDTSSTMRGFN